MKNHKPILFVDFDGTICHDRFWRSLAPEMDAKIQALLFGQDTARVRDWMLGKYSAEEINQFVADDINMPFETLWPLFVKECETMHVDQSVLERLSALRSAFTLILITGNMDSFSRFTVPALKLARYFDHISNSYDEGRHKTDHAGQIFADYARKYQADISTSVLIDDSKNACEIFALLGGKSCHITAGRDINHFLSALEQGL